MSDIIELSELKKEIPRPQNGYQKLREKEIEEEQEQKVLNRKNRVYNSNKGIKKILLLEVKLFVLFYLLVFIWMTVSTGSPVESLLYIVGYFGTFYKLVSPFIIGGGAVVTLIFTLSQLKGDFKSPLVIFFLHFLFFPLF